MNHAAEKPAGAPESSEAPVLIFYALEIESGYLEDRLRNTSRVLANGFQLLHGELNHVPVIVVRSGTGYENAARAAFGACRAHRPRCVISAGLAGALAPGWRIGDIFCPAEVLSGERRIPISWRVTKDLLPQEFRARAQLEGALLTSSNLVCTPREKADLYAQTGARGVDMETFATAEVCKELNLPFLSLRAISDTAEDRIPNDIKTLLAQKTKSAQLGATMSLIWRRPGSVKELFQLRQNAIECAVALADTIEFVLNFPLSVFVPRLPFEKEPQS
ncbi:MAG: hypothetical protein Q4D38_03385 [Planctomycetia bacterium]|nr:hypothetical protein [Planctomycetia bacterium]